MQAAADPEWEIRPCPIQFGYRLWPHPTKK